MERAEILTTLRGDHASSAKATTNHGNAEKNREQKRVRFDERFPPSFASAPENVKNIILWCLERDPSKRPSAEELLSVSSSSSCFQNALFLHLTLQRLA
jgi:serine/threonine protein kinase